MKPERLHLRGDIIVSTNRDINGRYFIAYARGAAVYIRDPAELPRFLDLYKGGDRAEALKSWLASLAAADAERQGPAPEPLGDAQVEGSFDPLAHQGEGLGPEDPQFQTRTVI